MLTEEKIRKILQDRYSTKTGNLKSDFNDFKNCFKLFHKILSGEDNMSLKGYVTLGQRYVNIRDCSEKGTKALSECVELL